MMNIKQLRREMVVEVTDGQLAIITNTRVKAHECDCSEPVVNTNNGYLRVADIKRIVPAEEVL